MTKNSIYLLLQLAHLERHIAEAAGAQISLSKEEMKIYLARES